MPKLLISLPSGDISKEFSGDVVSIGRTPDNKVQIDHHSVSAHHARLTLSNGNYKIKDLGSTNRTCVNGTPIHEAELTGSCILRIGMVECVFKIEKTAAAAPGSQLQSQLTELQRQMDSLVKARDVISHQNRTLTNERDEAKNEVANLADELSDAKKLIDRLSGGSTDNKEFEEISGKLTEAKKQIHALIKERDALVESNNALKTEVVTLTAKLNGQHKAEQAAQHVTVAVQQNAAAHVKAEMDESVEEEDEEFEEQQLAVAGQRTAAAGNSAGRPAAGIPLLSSWLNRGGKLKSGEEQPAQTNRITSMPAPSVPAPAVQAASKSDSGNVVVAPSAPSGSPALRLLNHPAQPGAHNSSLGSPAVKIGRVSANISPQNPGIKPAWDILNNMRRSLHYFLRHQDELKVLQDMAESAHQLTEMSASDLLRPIYELAAAQEALLADLHASPVNINPSTLRTVGQCIDFIATLINEANLTHIKDVTTARIFAIDDDEGILETIKATMEMVHVNVVTSLSSTEGLTMLAENNFDLILLDVGIPEMNGMDICSRVRAMPHHQKTPIVFLTGEATVQNRVQSTLNGGNDLIGKPFSVLELAVKAITWIFKGQLGLV